MVQPPHALPMIPEVMLSLNQKNSGRLFSLQIRLRLETAVRDWNPHFLNAKTCRKRWSTPSESRLNCFSNYADIGIIGCFLGMNIQWMSRGRFCFFIEIT